MNGDVKNRDEMFHINLVVFILAWKGSVMTVQLLWEKLSSDQYLRLW